MSTPQVQTTTTGFNPTQAPDPTLSLIPTYPAVGLTGLLNDPNQYFMSAMIDKSSSPNITYTDTTGGIQMFSGNKMWIVGNAAGSTNLLHSVQGVPDTSVAGELIIQNLNPNGNQVLYMCYLLCLTSVSQPGADQIDNILNATPTTSMMTVDFDAAIYSKPTNGPVYFQYTSAGQSYAPSSIVIVASQPIFITSVNIMTLQNNLGLFDMPGPTPSSAYSVIQLNQPGEWMECDYVPIDSDEVTTFNLPFSSGLVQNSGMFNSMQTIILFIVFFFICVFAYLVIPISYLALVSIWLKRMAPNAFSNSDKKDYIWYLDAILSILVGGTGFILICVALFTTNLPNANDVILSGFCLGIIYIIGYIVIQSKKMSGGTFITGVDYDKA